MTTQARVFSISFNYNLRLISEIVIRHGVLLFCRNFSENDTFTLLVHFSLVRTTDIIASQSAHRRLYAREQCDTFASSHGFSEQTRILKYSYKVLNFPLILVKSMMVSKNRIPVY
jgi:hypothetical protein